MLNCEQVTEKLSALLDGQLSAGERVAVRVHLLMCVHCRRFERHLRDLVTALRRREWVEAVDRKFIDRTVERIENAPTGQTATD